MKNSLLWYLRTIKDPRVWRTKIYELEWVLVIVICGIISGKKTLVEIADWAGYEREWFKNIFGINAIPSHDTMGRVLAKIRQRDLAEAFNAWAKESLLDCEVTTVAIDGKTLCGSRSKTQPAKHIVSAWVGEVGLTIAAELVPNGCSEPLAIKTILQRLILDGDLNGKLVTIDAIATKKDIAALIIHGGGDYLLPIKKNNRDLCEEVQFLFEDAAKNKFKNINHTTYAAVEKGHGRIEKRHTVAIHDMNWLSKENRWIGLRTLIMTRRERIADEKITIATVYHMSSLEADAARFACLIREHWGIENNLHRALDINFEEDASRVRTGFAAYNLSVVRRISLSVLIRERSIRSGIAGKMRRAANCPEYRNKLAQSMYA